MKNDNLYIITGGPGVGKTKYTSFHHGKKSTKQTPKENKHGKKPYTRLIK